MYRTHNICAQFVSNLLIISHITHQPAKLKIKFVRRKLFIVFVGIQEGMASLPYPRSPLAYPPTEATKLAEVSGGEEPPTDAHR